MEFERKPPVQVGDIREVRIENIGSGGDGIARIDGYVVFVPGVKVDDVVTIRITKVLRKYGFAEVV
ncbi:putative RNA-binding protein, contains TRAM domain [Geoglobus ahangari]|uniref:Putative RNA-binding protein, contains TRAM domain n=1 Tax=Geoglobus ahangari TaxID=113653 RepID=A0A0F7IFQ7_9EURY|nr:TRAM domain-containing protein [Geoglobus ahangari]AKG92383.1 putative RNA-binding protein, contains TRAM domain [Geoglobus ahangari]NOY11263.1 TRAM domain-containing protein [Archaeoglobi archaeon]